MGIEAKEMITNSSLRISHHFIKVPSLDTDRQEIILSEYPEFPDGDLKIRYPVEKTDSKGIKVITTSGWVTLRVNYMLRTFGRKKTSNCAGVLICPQEDCTSFEIRPFSKKPLIMKQISRGCLVCGSTPLYWRRCNVRMSWMWTNTVCDFDHIGNYNLEKYIPIKPTYAATKDFKAKVLSAP